MTTKTDTRITQKLLRQWNACYYREANGQAKMDALFAGRDSLTPTEVVETDISNDDKIWVLTRALSYRDPWLCYDFCLWAAHERLADVDPADRDRVAAVIDSVSNIHGKSEEECWRAYRAAYAADARAVYAAAAYAAAADDAASAYAAAYAYAYAAAAADTSISKLVSMLEYVS